MSQIEGQGKGEPNTFNFGRFVLDLNRGCLVSNGRDIPLRPKTFAVLAFLVQRPGQLVSKEELLEAVWPGLIVTDDTLVQSIGELRRTLGDAEAKIIVTVPRRGYRFEVTAAPPERRRATGVQALRFQWKYGLLAPLAVLLAFAAIWFATSREDRPVAVADTRPAIAILPFQDQSEGPEREYLADGVTQDLINSLGRFSELTVMSWNAVATYKGAIAQPGEIARVLNVRYQVEGSVRLADGRLRVSAQLVGLQGRVLWSSRYDEAAADAFALQDRLTREIAGALAIRVSEQEQRRVAAKPPASFDAYDYLLRARPAIQRPTRASLAEARGLLRHALEIDANYGAAHAALGETFHAAISLGWAENPDDYWKRVERHAGDALRVDADNVHARVLLGRLHLAYNRYRAAEVEMDRAVEINPNNADALAGRGNGLLWMGRARQAIETLELAQRIDPELNPFERFALGLAYYLEKRYDDAIEQCELNLRLAPEATFNLPLLAAAYAQSNRTADAQRTAATLRTRDPTFDASTFGTKFEEAGDLARLREGLDKAGLYTADRRVRDR